MTDDEKRIAIAEACGWANINVRPWGTMATAPNNRPKDCEQDEHGQFHLPNYLNDLNAMHEAEKALSGADVHNYVYALFDLLDTNHDGWDNASTRLVFFPTICATARQRAEAFLKTIGKL